MLDHADFFRASHSYLVHACVAKTINPCFSGKLLLYLAPATEQNDVAVSKEKAMDFKKWMGK